MCGPNTLILRMSPFNVPSPWSHKCVLPSHPQCSNIQDWPFAMLNPKHHLKATSPAYLEIKQNKTFWKSTSILKSLNQEILRIPFLSPPAPPSPKPHIPPIPVLVILTVPLRTHLSNPHPFLFSHIPPCQTNSPASSEPL